MYSKPLEKDNGIFPIFFNANVGGDRTCRIGITNYNARNGHFTFTYRNKKYLDVKDPDLIDSDSSFSDCEIDLDLRKLKCW